MTRTVYPMNKLSLVVAIAAALLPAAALGQSGGPTANGPATSTMARAQASDSQSQDKTNKPAAQTRTLGEVTVTAQRITTPLQKTPVAVTALSPEILADRQVMDVQDLVSQIPGVQIDQATSNTSQMKVTFRGARTETGGIRANGTVGIYIDNVIQPRPNGSFFNLFDVDQVEVLRGPQGTLYGRNTSGGAIKIQTKLPSYYWTGAAEVGVGNFSSREGKAYLSGPIVADKLAFSISGVKDERDGFVYGLARGRRIGNVDTGAERFKLLYQPTEAVSIDLSLYAMQDNSEQVAPIPLKLLPGVVDPYVFRGRNLTINELYQNLGQKTTQRGGSLNANWDVSDVLKIDSISGYGQLHQYSQGNDGFLTAARQAANGGTLDVSNNITSYMNDKWVSQEFNALYTGDRLEGVVGLYYFREQGGTSSRTAGVATNFEKSLVTAPAVFVQGTYQIGGGVSAVAGLRYTRETTDYYSHTLSSPAGPQIGRSVFPSTTPKLGINWQINPNLFTYASWTQGTRSGGFNSRTRDGELKPNPYAAEWVDSYEIGGKFMSSDNKFRLNTTLYQADYSDQQLVSIVAGPGYVALFYNNAGGSRVRGLELESNWQASDSLNLYAVAAFQSGKYTKTFYCFNQYSQQIDCTNKHLKGLPARKTSLGFKYSPAVSVIPGQLSFNGSWDYNTKIYNYSAGPLPPPDDYGPTPELNLFNASIRWVSPMSSWSVSLEGRNLTNKHYASAGYASSNPISPGFVAYMGNPRETWLRVGYSF